MCEAGRRARDRAFFYFDHHHAHRLTHQLLTSLRTRYSLRSDPLAIALQQRVREFTPPLECAGRQNGPSPGLERSLATASFAT